MAVKTWTVDELCSAVGDAIRAVFPDELWIRGQISGLRKSPAGHVYFDLIEPGASGRGADDRISVVAFRGPLRGIEAVLAKVGNLALENDIEVRIRGKLDYYPPQGRVQFLMNAIDPRYTLGQLAAERDEVLRRLAAEGLLTANRERELTEVPLTVGLVTSDDSAAYNDFVDELESSGYGFRVELVDARVQGLDAEASLVQAINTLSRRSVDVIAVVRGGGAKTDLIAFDRESVARSIASSPVPVFVGIGHEIDRSVADEVAFASLKTPTACAAAIVDRVRSFDDRLNALARRLSDRAGHRLHRARERLDRDALQLARSTTARLVYADDRLDRAATDLRRRAGRGAEAGARRLDVAAAAVGRVSRRLDAAAESLDTLQLQLGSAVRRVWPTHEQRLNAAERLMGAAHPDRTLARGFSIVRGEDGLVERGVPAAGSTLQIETATAQIDATVARAEARPRPTPEATSPESTDPGPASEEQQ